MTATFKKRKVDAGRILTAARDSLSSVVVQTSSYVVGQVYDVPLKRLRSNPANARALYAASGLDDMCRSMREHGQTSAASGFVDSDGDVVLIDGHRRLHVCEKLGWNTLRVEMRPVPENEQVLYLASRAANVERAEQTPLDDALVWRRLLDRKVFPSQVVLAKTLGISESEVSRTLALAELPGRIAQALAEQSELLNLKMLNALREFFMSQGEEKTLLFVFEVASEGLSYREVEARRKALEQGPATRPRSERRALQFRGATGVIRTFDKDGRLEVSLKGLKPKDAADVLKRLEGVFKS